MMKEVTVNSRNSEKSAVRAIRKVLGSRCFPFFTAAILLLCNYAAWDIAMYYFMAAVIAAMLVFLKDLTPLIGQFLFLNVIMSEKNSPSNLLDESGYLTQPVIYVQIAVLAAVLVAALIYRYVVTFRAGNFRPCGVFWGLCALSVFLVLNGAGAAGYTALNLCYGIVLAFAFVGVFVLIGGNSECSEENFRTVGWAFVAFSALLLVELAVKYVGIWDDFKAFLGDAAYYNKIKTEIVFGWGNWNTMGMLLAISIAPVFLVASKYRHGWLLHLYAALITLGAFMTCSRQAMAALPVYVLSAITAMVTGKRRLLHVCSFCAVALTASTVLIAGREWFSDYYYNMVTNLFDSGSGYARIKLLYASLDFFAANPFFGSGFFVDFESNGAADFANVSFVPLMAHNTFGELIAVGGIFAIASYCLHRVQTVIAFAENPSVNKLYFVFAIGSLLAMSLVDNHIFYILPTMVYSGLLVFTSGKKNRS